MSEISGIRIWFPGLKVRIPAFQAGNAGFKSRRGHCGHRTTVVQQIVALQMGFDSPWSPHGWVCLAARLLRASGTRLATTGAERRPADCKSVTRETAQVRVLPHPLKSFFVNMNIKARRGLELPVLSCAKSAIIARVSK